jgi:hypothetical protein
MTIGAKLYWGDLLTPILGAILALIIFGIRKYFDKECVFKLSFLKS